MMAISGRTAENSFFGERNSYKSISVILRLIPIWVFLPATGHWRVIDANVLYDDTAKWVRVPVVSSLTLFLFSFNRLLVYWCTMVIITGQLKSLIAIVFHLIAHIKKNIYLNGLFNTFCKNISPWYSYNWRMDFSIIMWSGFPSFK